VKDIAYKAYSRAHITAFLLTLQSFHWLYLQVNMRFSSGTAFFASLTSLTNFVAATPLPSTIAQLAKPPAFFLAGDSTTAKQTAGGGGSSSL
jgi:hypothetical protein